MLAWMASCVAASQPSAPAGPAPPGAVVAEPPPAPTFVWWEGERAARTNFPARHAFEPASDAERDVLSGGAWAGVDGEHGPGRFLEYDLAVPEGGEYGLYARKFWKHGPFRWRFDGGPWGECGEDPALLDEAPLRTFVGANWVGLGRVTLDAGSHVFRVEVTADRGAAAFDCFVLVRGTFTPRGRLRPGERWGRAPAGWFAFEPDADSPAGSPISLRSLNEAFAGERGRIAARDGGFVHADGERVRFWGVNVGGEFLALDDAEMAALARRLAALGVNLARFHGPVWRDDLSPDPARVASLRRLVAALKREGVFTALSIYYPAWLDLDARHGFEGYSGQHPYGLLFWSEDLRRVHRAWWRAVLTTPDAEGVTLAADPAVAMIELVNEDSLLFWTFKPYETIPGPQIAALERRFGDWLAGRHGSVDAALRGWRGGPVRGDDPAAGRAGFMPLWDIINRGGVRAAETAEFLAATQRQFFEEATVFVREELGYGGLVIGSNWITADARLLGPLDTWSNTACDVMDRHGYFGVAHEGPRAGYAIDAGDRYADRSALRFDPEKPGGEPAFHLPIMEVSHDGKPAVNSEINWPEPNRFRAELPVLASAYGLLQGTDGVMLFACAPAWDRGPRKFGIDSPAVLGQSPAAAAIYRRGLVREGAPVADAAVALRDLRALRGGPVVRPQNLDAFRRADVPAGGTLRTTGAATLDPLACLVGPVSVRFTGRSEPSDLADLSPFIDRRRRIVRSNTGELTWDFGRGVLTIDAPAAAGAVGFLGGERLALGSITIEPANEFASILLVALDDRPLAESGRLLLQVMTEESSFGWSAPVGRGGMRTVESLGSGPVIVRAAAGRVTLSRPDGSSLRVTSLDHDGRPTPRVTPGPVIALEPATLWYLVER